MNRKELNRALLDQNIRHVFVWVRLTEGGDGRYVEVSKAALKRTLAQARHDQEEYRAVVRENEPDALYIN